MTSHFINYFVRRKEAYLAFISRSSNSTTTTNSSSKPVSKLNNGDPKEHCAFCEIVKGNESAHIVYEDENVLAFLDILPIRPGHVLVVPKKHYARLNLLPEELSISIAKILPKLTRALMIATGQPDFNVVSNNGYAQIVHHLHIHLVPAPFLNGSSNNKSSSRSGWASIIGREELDDEEGEILAKKIKEEMNKQIRLSKL